MVADEEVWIGTTRKRPTHPYMFSGNLASTLANENRARLEYRTTYMRIMRAVRHWNAPPALCASVENHLVAQWDRDGGRRVQDIVLDLPRALQTEVQQATEGFISVQAARWQKWVDMHRLILVVGHAVVPIGTRGVAQVTWYLQ